jgi:antitoxin component of MazEF toxin-antitoxin module
MSENKTWTFKAEEIFENIPDDPENVMMNIPSEIAESIGLNPGDTVRVLWGDQGTIILEKTEFDEDGNIIPSENLNEVINQQVG